MRAPSYLVALAALLLIVGCSRGDSAAPPSESSSAEMGDFSPGLAVGEKAPAFELIDQSGQRRSLANILKSGNVALVFYRSADWCPFCRKHLVQLRNDIEKLNAAGVQVVGISYDSLDILKKISDSMEIPFLLLSDEGSKTIHEYGLHYEDGLPHPGTVLIDQSGVIRAKLFEKGYRIRHTNDELVAAAEKLE